MCSKTEKEEQSPSKAEFNESSVAILLQTAKSEYDNEHNRTTVIDSKTNISLPIISAFLLALIQANDYKTIFNLPTLNFFQWLLPATLFLFYTATLVLGFLADLLMIRVIFTRQYKTLNIRDIYNKTFLKNAPCPISLFIITRYCEASEHNKEQNNLRIKWYKKSWLLTVVALFLYLIYMIIKNNMWGSIWKIQLKNL